VGGRRPYVPVIGPGAPGVTAAWVTRSNFRIARAQARRTLTVDGVTAVCDCGVRVVRAAVCFSYVPTQFLKRLYFCKPVLGQRSFFGSDLTPDS
jgi:hypothetical protein